MSHQIAPPAKGIVLRKKKPAKKSLAPVHRLKSVKIHVKRQPVLLDTASKIQDDRFSRAESLYVFWETQFYEAFGVEYVPQSRPADLGRIDDIMDEVGETAKIERMMRLLLTHKDLEWVGQKNITWLSKAKNRTFIAPLMVQRKRTAEFRGDRTLTAKITFRGS